MELAVSETDAARIAAGRSRLYQLLASVFAFPDEELFAFVRDGSLAAVVRDIAGGLPYPLETAPTLRFAAPAPSYGEFESEYIRLFDVGPAGPPCPLYGGLYGGGDRMKVMEDATRFYNFFQLRVAEQLRELPDHITTELEFLHYLTFREAEVHRGGGDAGSLWRAERDFLTRHVCKWLPKLHARVTKQSTGDPFFAALVGCAAEYGERDRAWAAAMAATAG